MAVGLATSLVSNWLNTLKGTAFTTLAVANGDTLTLTSLSVSLAPQAA